MKAATQEETSNPRVGMLGIVRKRRAVISEVRPFSGENGVLHLVRLEYMDESRPSSEEVVWEMEPARRLLNPNALPNPDDRPMPAEDFDALVRAARWNAVSPYLDPDHEGPLQRRPVCSPFYGAVQVEDYQLVPLLKALAMPRINLMIADDVGLGKTVEAGLVVRELLIRRRIQRILILTPASLRLQWRDEMWSKFALRFDVVDRGATLRLKRSIGIDANPWRSCPRIIASYHYLRQHDILEQFRSACRTPEGSPQLPWDLLIVDEVHNLMPSPFGEDSELCKMLRTIAPYFEHRLFLTATPHNGHTRSFSGLLELLDPVRFSRTEELKPAERERAKQIVIRRLKRDINVRTDPPKFCTRRPPTAQVLEFSPEERRLIEAVAEFRKKVRSVIAGQSKNRRLAGSFAIEILGKRLLSGPATFAESWRRCRLGLDEDETAEDTEVVAAEKHIRDESVDDRESQHREAAASGVIGSWLKAFADDVIEEIGEIDAALADHGFDLQSGDILEQNPTHDARFETLLGLIENLLRRDGGWSKGERLVVFTEYKTTLDYLLRRLRDEFPGQEERFYCLYGGMDDPEREQVKEAFNDPDDPVRVLIATDAAAEGLNLQSTARYLLHYDCPWNPARLEQRNGRLDRHGQARDVFIHHFASDEDADLKFMAYVIRKVDQIREHLGATGELFDEATHRCLIEGVAPDDVQRELDSQIDAARGQAAVEADDSSEFAGEDVNQRLSALKRELDLDEVAQHQTLESAMAIQAGRPQLSELDETDRCRILQPSLAGWTDTIDEAVRRPFSRRELGPVPQLAFSEKPFIDRMHGRPVFRPRVDTIMLHLGHPLMAKAISTLTRRRFPGPLAVSRWAVRYGEVPAGAEALILLHLEELAINELRETFHHWIRTLRLPVRDGELSASLGHAPAAEYRRSAPCQDRGRIEQARELLIDIERDLQQAVGQVREQLTADLRNQLEKDGETARSEEERRYRSRQGEVSTLIAENTLAKLERDIDRLKQQRQQGLLFGRQAALDELDRSIEIKQEELRRRQAHYEEVREQLARERERTLNRLIPRRYSIPDQAQVFPVAVEVRFPAPLEEAAR